MTAAQPASPVTEAVRSLEVRWIFPGELGHVSWIMDGISEPDSD
jgi:hypothetical protein